MRLDTPRARLDLADNETARLRQACRTRLDCLDGAAWVTLDRDTRDIVLTRGQSFVVDSSADVIVSGLHGGAVVDVLPPRRAPRAATSMAARPGRAWAAWTAWLRRRVSGGMGGVGPAGAAR